MKDKTEMSIARTVNVDLRELCSLKDGHPMARDKLKPLKVLPSIFNLLMLAWNAFLRQICGCNCAQDRGSID
jgi:hypothetical protein